MVKSFTSEEFIDYVTGLSFDRIEDLLVFCQSYYDAYKSAIQQGVEEDIARTTRQWLAVAGHFSPYLLVIVKAFLDGDKNATEDAQAV